MAPSGAEKEGLLRIRVVGGPKGEISDPTLKNSNSNKCLTTSNKKLLELNLIRIN